MDGSRDDRCPPRGASPVAPSPAKESDGPAQSSSSSSSSPAARILGTSYFATPRLLGGVGGGRRSSFSTRLNEDGRVMMSDRKFYLDTFRPRALITSTVRVTAINVSTTFSSFFTDQLRSEQDVESMVDSGKITAGEADDMNEEWEEREWKLRKDALPEKIGWALARFHACTALMRFYEFAVARYALGEVGVPDGPAIVDGLTRDPYRASLRTSQMLKGREHAPGKVVSSADGRETSTDRELARRMFATCLWANAIPFLAELTVQQMVLAYGYGKYYRAKRRRKRSGEGKTENGACEPEEEGGTVDESAYALALMFRSSRLTIARGMSWIAASAGGAAGSVVYPGWGTVFGIQIGDALVGALTD